MGEHSCEREVIILCFPEVMHFLRNNRILRSQIIWLCLLPTFLLLSRCDHGLNPNEAANNIASTPGFGGIVRIVSALPPPDSLRDLRVVAFRNYPPKDIVLEVATKQAVFTDSTLNFKDKVISYKIQQAEVIGEFKYVVVAQQYGANILTDWRVVGVYTITSDVTKPSSIMIPTGTFLNNINMDVDFYNLPPQPF